MRSPDFSFFHGQSVVSVKTGRAYTLERMTALPDTQETLANLVRICNEPEIYNILFKNRCEGKPYASENGRLFLDWCSEGWKNHTHFVFAVRDEQGRHVGALDIKSVDIEVAEIGYWVSASHPGVMTPAVKTLCKIAKTAGFKSLSACTAIGNHRSQKVLLNNGFRQAPEAIFQNNQLSYFFKKKL
ncbi:MAG: GNAT family N-acetyltransferase [Alphaproteobacteria bacterium]|nr:GNAT family N-acetyltransferase [Alphaproteobacteria bacterium]